MTLHARRVPAAILLALCGCIGPYADVGQKLDVGLRLSGGETWIAAVGSETRILVLGRTPDGQSSQFAFSRLEAPVAAGTEGHTAQGVWQEHGGTMFLTVNVEYTLLDESSVGTTQRRGAFRKDGLSRLIRLDVAQGGGQLRIAGDPGYAGTYLRLAEALSTLGSATPDDAACAFHVANLLVMTSQVRVVGFGGPGMLQYRNGQDFEGTVAGTLSVQMNGGLLAPDVRIGFRGLVDFPGVQLDGDQLTHTDSGGTGKTEGTLLFTFRPAPGGTAAAPVTGSLRYDLVITDGVARGGEYTVALDGGATGAVQPMMPPQPPLAACLHLP